MIIIPAIYYSSIIKHANLSYLSTFQHSRNDEQNPVFEYTQLMDLKQYIKGSNYIHAYAENLTFNASR